MASSIKLPLLTLAATLLLTACTSASFKNTPTEIFYKDGRVAYVASCKAANWGPCLEQAGTICRNAGYTVLEKTSQMSYGESEKELIFACNGKPDAVEQK